jgi:hypothetical protein
MAQRVDANAQAYRVYNTWTDASNYERGVFDWQTTANTLTIATESAGTGSARNLSLWANNALVEIHGQVLGTNTICKMYLSGSERYSFFNEGISGTGRYLNFRDCYLAGGVRFNARTWLVDDAADSLAQRNGTAAQLLSVYNTWTDASNYERGVFDWQTTANTLTIGAAAAGTGTLRDVSFIGDDFHFNGSNIFLSSSSYIAGGTNAIEFRFASADYFGMSSSVLNMRRTLAFGWKDGFSINSIVSATDTLLYRDDADGIVALRNGTLTHTLRVYNTYTDASNYERGIFDWQTTANTLTIGAEAGGIGVERSVDLIGSTITVRNDVTVPTFKVDGGSGNDFELQLSYNQINSYAKTGLAIDGPQLQISASTVSFDVLDLAGTGTLQQILALDANNILINTSVVPSTANIDLGKLSLTKADSRFWNIYLRESLDIDSEGNGGGEIKVFNTSDTTRTNYEVGVFDWTTTANTLTIGTKALGTGTARQLHLDSASTLLIDAASNITINRNSQSKIVCFSNRVEIRTVAPVNAGTDQLGLSSDPWKKAWLDQGTNDDSFIDFAATVDADATSAISSLTTSGAVTHHIQISINGTTAWIPVSTTDPT